MNYTQLADQFANTHTINCHILFEIISKFSPYSNINVLDFGCGTGNYIKAITTYTNYHVYGVEPCKEMILYAKKQNWIDFDAGFLTDGGTFSDMSAELFRFVLDAASGNPSKSERSGYRDMAIFKQNVTL